MRGIGFLTLACVSCIDVGDQFSAQFGDITLATASANQPPLPGSVQQGSPRLTPLPPISGGTLWISNDDTTAVAADPENDAVWFVDLTSHAIQKVALEPGDQPGRIVEDSAGRVHVVLRAAGAIATMQLGATPFLVGRHPVCDEPRGLAYRDTRDTLLIACADGQLLTMSTDGTQLMLLQQLPDDLRDVVVSGTDLYVSRFRSAQILKLDAQGQLTTINLASTMLPPTPLNPPGIGVPQVAWRMVALPGGGIAVSHQSELATPLFLESGSFDAGFVSNGGNAYGSGACQSVVTSTLSVLADGQPELTGMLSGALPVDVATSQDGYVAMISASGTELANAPLSSLTPAGGPGADGGFAGCGSFEAGANGVLGQPVAVAFRRQNVHVARDVVLGWQDTRLVVQLRSPPGLAFGPSETLPFPVSDVEDPGHQLFHTQTPSGLACASCHPEGRDDGHVWQFVPDGPRRTQNLTGGLLATAPFHWDGAFADMGSLMDAVLVGRMGAQHPSGPQKQAMAEWVNSIPRPKVRPAPDAAAATRGQQLFESAEVGCSSCHFGPRFTSNANSDVGTGRAFQVPSLTGVVARAPYLHDGCAQTLEDRFVCGGGDLHGHTSQLTSQQLGDLVAYLKTL